MTLPLLRSPSGGVDGSLRVRQAWVFLLRFSVLAGIFLTQSAQVPVYEIYVSDFGAKCDGATDDTAAFDAAHAALPVGAPGDVAPGGGTIVLPRGVCLVNNWTITKSAVVVRGMGHGWNFNNLSPAATVLKAAPGASTVVTIATIRTYRVVLRDLTVNGAKTASVGVATIGTGWRLERVGLVSATTRQLDNKVEAQNADSNDSGGIFDSLVVGNIRLASASIRVERTYFNGNYKPGVSGVPTAINVEGVSPSVGTSSVAIVNNTFDSYGTPVIDIGAVQTVRAVTVSGNFFSNVRSTGSGNIITLGYSNGIDSAAIVGNYFSGEIPGFTISRAIYARLVTGLTIKSNYFGGNYKEGTGAPILLSGPWGDHVIEGNTGGSVEWNGYKSETFVSSHWLNPYVSYNPIGTILLKGIRLQTTTAMPTVMYEIPLVVTESALIRARVFGKSGGSIYSFVRTVSARNSGGGATIPQGALLEDYTYTDNAAASCKFVAFGDNVQMVIGGIAATSISWWADLEIIRQ